MLGRFVLTVMVLVAFVSPAKSQDAALVTFKSLSLDAAQELAQGTVALRFVG